MVIINLTADCEYRLFDKTLGILYRTSQTDALERVNGFSYLYIKESSIYFRDQYGTLNSFEINSGTTIQKMILSNNINQE